MPSFTDVTIPTARLLLRPMAPRDVDALFAMRSDPVVQRYGSHPPWTDRQTAVDYIDRNIKAMADGTHAQFAIERREDAAVVGTCTLFHLDAQCRSAEVGYVLQVSEWGKGYASEAVSAMLDWGFEHLDLNRVGAGASDTCGLAALLVRPDGFVAWASDEVPDPAGLQRAATRWFGAPTRS